MSPQDKSENDYSPGIGSNHQPSPHSTPAVVIVIAFIGLMLFLYSILS